MKLLVFAHTPPPHHGQSFMVQLMLAGFGGDRRHARRFRARSCDEGQTASDTEMVGRLGIECYHVNARLSQKLEDIGDFRVAKFLLLLGYCAQAIWCRFRYGVTNLYYIPAPGKRSALYRDWVVMFLCRPFFKNVVLHWHAAGLAKWLETVVQLRTRALTYRVLKRVDLSIVLSKYNRADAEKLFSRRITVVSNGIADPCPGFDSEVLPPRQARFNARCNLASGQLPKDSEHNRRGLSAQTVRVLYLAHCTREKGVFDTLAGVRLANQMLAGRQSPISLCLWIAGTFVSPQDEVEFQRLIDQPGTRETVEYFGFVSGDRKNQLLRDADLFCFPTYYQNENQPVNLIEAMAFGLPILTTRWRSIPELFPANYPGLVDIRSPEQIADALIGLMTSETGECFRDIFLRSFTLQRHLAGLADAFRTLEQDGMPQVAAPR